MIKIVAGRPESGDEQQYRLLVEFSPYCLHQIDLVFLDVIMPRASGVKTYKAIRQIDETMPVVFTTGYNQNNTLPAELLNKGDLYVLPKSYDQPTLLSTIEQALQRP